MAAEIRTLYDGDTEVLPRTTASAVSTEDGTSVDVALQKNKKDLLDHIEDKDNPHGVTAAQTGAAEAVHSHAKTDISDFAHTHAKADISDFEHTHTKEDISNFPTEMTPTAHTHNASDITAGTFDSARLPVVPVDKGGTGATTSEQARTNLGSEGKHSTTTAALLVSSWISNSQSISVLGVTPNNTIIISPAAESHKAWGEAGIYCSAQAEGMLTFICTKVPSEELTVNIVIMGG